MSHPQPDHGGSFIRDPRTGALAPETAAEAMSDTPAEPDPVPVEPVTTKGGK